MRKFLILIAAAIPLLAPFSHGMLFENLAHKNLYSSPSEFEKFGEMNNAHLVSCQKLWGIWNSSEMEIYQGEKAIKTIHGPVEGAWLGERFAVIKAGDLVEIKAIYGNNTVKLKISPVNVKMGNRYIVIQTHSNAKIVDMKTNKIYTVDGDYRYYLLSTGVYLVSNHNISRWYGKILWTRSLNTSISDLAYHDDRLYILTTKFTELISTDGSPIGKLQVSGDKMVIYGSLIATYSEFLGDDEGKVWGFRIYHINGTLLNSFSVYMQPQGFAFRDNMLMYYTPKMIHINIDGMDYVSNRSFSEFGITQDTMVGVRESSIYLLNTGSIHLKFVGHDNDLDWIPDSVDPDDDNDGMPDWWETEHGLDPDNPADRNQDPDHDGLTNYQEYLNDTDPHNWDTDGDGYSDGYEVANGMNPLVPNFNLRPHTDMLGGFFLALFGVLFVLGRRE